MLAFLLMFYVHKTMHNKIPTSHYGPSDYKA